MFYNCQKCTRSTRQLFQGFCYSCNRDRRKEYRARLIVTTHSIHRFQERKTDNQVLIDKSNATDLIKNIVLNGHPIDCPKWLKEYKTQKYGTNDVNYICDDEWVAVVSNNIILTVFKYERLID